MMKNLFIRAAGLLRKAWLWSLLLTLTLALLAWFFGPLVAIAGHTVLEAATSRLLTGCLLFLGWALIALLLARRKPPVSSALSEGEGPSVADQGQADSEQVTVRKRFKDAVCTLRRSSVYRGHSQRWRKALPWYLLIGPEGSGKTSLLEHSGLKFPLNLANGAVNAPPPATQQCDWYFSQGGVLVDTCGRYLEQQEPADSRGWLTLLKLLRRHRRNRPINGVLVSIPVEALLAPEPERLQQLAAQVRRRLLEIHRQLRGQPPVYLVLTKADKVAGFEAFFSELSHEESQQVLGVSFKENQRGTDPAVLHEALENLLRRLDSQVIVRLHQERNLERRGRILDFPHHLSLIGAHLASFVEAAFAGNRYEPHSLLRGVYFTSAPHGGDPLPATETVDEASAFTATALRHARPLRGAARFIHNVFSAVVFSEAGLARLDAGERRRLRWGQRALYASAVACLGLFGLAWANGFAHNQQRFEQLRSIGQQFTQRKATVTPLDEPAAILPLLDAASGAVQVFPPSSALALHERNGLYQGEPVTRVLNERYQHELTEQLLPRIAHQMEAQIRASLNNREALLEALRAYLMLGLPEHRDADALKGWLVAYWERAYAGNPSAQAGLNRHLARLLAVPFRYTTNHTLIAQARQALQKVSLASLTYRTLREQARNLPPYRLDQHLGPRGVVFSGTQVAIPGLYTRQGYQQFFLARGAGAIGQLLQDNWVMGEDSNLDPAQLRTLMAELEQLYFRDYADHWNQALSKVAIQPLDSLGHGADQASALAGGNSPLLLLLAQVKDNTRFFGVEDIAAGPADGTDQPSGPGDLAKGLASQAAATVIDNSSGSAKTTLQRRFAPLHRLLDKHDAPSPELAPALAALADLHQQLVGLSEGNQPTHDAFELAKARINGKRSALDNLRTAASRLPSPVVNWLRTVGDNSWELVLADAYTYVNQHYQAGLYSTYAAALHERYPFYAHSTSDVALADFKAFFKAQGAADDFFDTYLKPFVAFDGNQYRLRSVDGRALPVSRGLLTQLANVHHIRRAFFAENPAEPAIKFSLEPYSLDSSLSRADFRLGAQQLAYRHGPIIAAAFQWPAAADEGLASLVVEELDGRRTGIQKNTGQWSVFRLFDLMEKAPHRGRDVLMLKAEVGGLRANYLLLSQRSPNPFDLTAVRNFRLPEVL